MYTQNARLSTPEQNEAKATSPKLDPIFRRKLDKLCRMRYGNHSLPDNADSRAMLVALLRFGLTDESANEAAPWCASELDGLKRQARCIKWRDIGKLGLLISLTYDERGACKFWILDPCDVPREEVRRRQAEKRAKADKERKKRQREERQSERQQVRSSNNRCDALLLILERGMKLFPDNRAGAVYPPRYYSDGWMTVSSLVKLAAKIRAFRRPDGQQLMKLRNAVRSTINQLERYGQIETKLQPGPYGMVMMVRKAAIQSGEADAFSGRPAALSALPTKAQKTGGFEPQQAASAGKADTVPMAHDNLIPSPRKVVPFKSRKAT